MGAGHGQHMAALKHMLGQPLRAAGVGQARVEDGLHQRVAPGDDVADHEEIGLERQLFRVEAFDQLDAQGPELVAHGRIDVGVAAGDGVAGFSRQGRQAAHEGAADAQDVNVHGEKGVAQARSHPRGFSR